MSQKTQFKKVNLKKVLPECKREGLNTLQTQSFLFSKTINTTSFSKYDQKNKHTHTHKQKQTVEIRDSPNYSTNRHLTVSFGSLV